MKTCAIINLWDGGELLPYCIDNWLKCVDSVLIIFSFTSNYGEEIKVSEGIYLDKDHHSRVKHIRWEPNLKQTPMYNEQAKREYGLFMARDLGFTHFVTSDVDEFYEPELFKVELKRFEDPNLHGLVCASQVYFKSPQLTIGLDTTRVPFIHNITPTLKYDFNRRYPFAWEGREIRIDPTRSFNINSGVEWSDIIMHHYSYVRKDIEIKIRNSTARDNIERSTIRQDLISAREGFYVEFYGKTLIRASVDFNMPEFYVPDIQPLAPEARPQSENS